MNMEIGVEDFETHIWLQTRALEYDWGSSQAFLFGSGRIDSAFLDSWWHFGKFTV